VSDGTTPPRRAQRQALATGARAERVQAAIYAISEAASSAPTLDALFPAIHTAVGDLLPAGNFYIALYDSEHDRLSFPYFVDEVDATPEPKPLGRGVTEYVLRTGEPLLASPSVAADLERSGEIELIGAPSIDWLGVPLKIGDTTFGVLVVQSYTPGIRYGEDDKAILQFVSRQVAMAIERTRAQEALRASEQRLRDIIEHSTNMFYSHTPDHVLTYVSPQSRQFFDCEPEEALVRWTELATQNPVNLVGLERTERAIETGAPQPPYELELVGMRGRRIWVEVREAPVVRNGRTVAIVGSLTDISERKRVEEALCESEDRYRRLVELSPDGIAIHRDGKVVFCNLTGAKLLGYAMAEELLDRPILEFVQPELHELVARRVREALADGRSQPPEEERFVHADGSLVDVEVTSTPFSYAGAPAVLVVFRDIRPRRQLEERVRHMQKMEAIGRLAGGVAHDFNNLLQALLSTVEVVRTRGNEPDRLAETLREMETNIRRGAALTRQLLLFARRELARSERLDLNEVVAGATSLLRRLVREDIRLSLVPECGDLPFDGDRGQIEQVLVNLVVNATDAMPDGGTLVICTGGSGAEVWVEVEDTGVGVPAELQQRIFEPFFTTKPPERGTGIGLAVVHGIITQHNGYVELTSTVGKGSTFRVVLPRAAAAAPTTPAPLSDADGPIHTGGGRVLVVEDEDGARLALEEILRALGFDVTVAASGEEGERLAAAAEFDVLLTDFVLPGIDGGELARRLGARSPSLQVIVMSGHAENERMRSGIMSGTVRFLQKPFDMNTLARALRAALDDGGAPR
jgi:PAS domain S-box-containing protein